MYSADILDIEFPCMRSILYTWSCAVQTLVGIYAVIDDPYIGQCSGHAYPCTNAEGLFITDADYLHSQTHAYTASLYSLHAGIVQIDTGETGSL